MLRRLCTVLTLVLALAIHSSLSGVAHPIMAVSENAFVLNNVRFVATAGTPQSPGDFIPNAAGRQVPAGHVSWLLTIDTTGLPDDRELATMVVQYHYTGVQLGATGLPNQGQLTNLDGTVTQIPGGLFTGWIDDCSSPLRTTYTDKTGTLQHSAFLGCSLNRIMNAYPDNVRLLNIHSPGYPSVVSTTLSLG